MEPYRFKKENAMQATMFVTSVVMPTQYKVFGLVLSNANGTHHQTFADVVDSLMDEQGEVTFLVDWKTSTIDLKH